MPQSPAAADRHADPPAVGNCFVATYPPFSGWHEHETDRFRSVLGERADASPFALYVHLPFCAQRCPFCQYLAYDGRASEIDRYLNAIGRELDMYARTPLFTGREVGAVYFGGGTPSLLSDPRITRLLTDLQHALPWSACREVTFESGRRGRP
jgi:oxygen-independent coproporphyrinogen-3 oxidase